MSAAKGGTRAADGFGRGQAARQSPAGRQTDMNAKSRIEQERIEQVRTEQDRTEQTCMDSARDEAGLEGPGTTEGRQLSLASPTPATPLARLEAALLGLRGRDCLVESAARALRAGAWLKGLNPDLAELEHNARVLVLRVVFAALFEWQTGHGRSLPERCGYGQVSLASIREALEMERSPHGHAQWNRLQELFCMFEKGNGNLLVPAFGGELFDSGLAPLLGLERVFSDEVLGKILDDLCGDEPREADFAGCEPGDIAAVLARLEDHHLGEARERLHRLVVRVDGEVAEGLWSDRDLARITNSPTHEILRHAVLEKESLCLFPRNGGQSGARLVAPALALPQAAGVSEDAAAIERLVARALARKGKGASILDVRVLDLACRNPQRLARSLDALAHVGMRRLEHDARLKAALSRERAWVARECQRLGLETNEVPLDELALLFRVLARSVHAVCPSPWLKLAASLVLWAKGMVYGLPLPCLALRLRDGQKVCATSLRGLDDMLLGLPEGSRLTAHVHRMCFQLETLQGRLAGMGDGSLSEVEEARRLFEEEVAPVERELCLAFSLAALRGKGVVPELDGLCAADLGALAKALFSQEPGERPGQAKGGLHARIKEQVMEQVMEQVESLHLAHPHIVFAHVMGEGRKAGFDIVFADADADVGDAGAHVPSDASLDELRKALELVARDGMLRFVGCAMDSGRLKAALQEGLESSPGKSVGVRIFDQGTDAGADAVTEPDSDIVPRGLLHSPGSQDAHAAPARARAAQVVEIERLEETPQGMSSPKSRGVPGIGSLGHLASWQRQPVCLNALAQLPA